MELLEVSDHYDKKSECWATTREVLQKRLEARAQAQNKNHTKKYKMSQVDELTKILHSLNRMQAPPISPVSLQDQSHVHRHIPEHLYATKSDVDDDIVILNRNPEMFLKQLNEPAYRTTKKLMLQNQPKIDQDDYSGILDNPFKLRLLVVYLQSNPKHFMTILKSESLTSEQLMTLNNAIKNEGTTNLSQAEIGAYASSKPIGITPNLNPDAEVEGFWSPISQNSHHDYQVALHMLEAQVDQQQKQADSGPYAPYVSQLASQAGNQGAHDVDMMDTIKKLNKNISDFDVRSDKLANLLARQTTVLGLIISKQTGKCVGAIDQDGKIKHCSHHEAQSPYDIIVNKRSYSLNLNNILQQHRLHGSSVKQILKQCKEMNMGVMGQCANVYGKIIGLIVRKDDGNHYIPTQPTQPVQAVPILALLVPNEKEGTVQIDSDSEEAPSVKSKSRYHTVGNNKLKGRGWLIGEEQEVKVQAIAEAEALAKANALARKVEIPQEETEGNVLERIKNAHASPVANHEEDGVGSPLTQESASMKDSLFGDGSNAGGLMSSLLSRFT
jgi:hypothetical protein